jgi:hypothetical protein
MDKEETKKHRENLNVIVENDGDFAIIEIPFPDGYSLDRIENGKLVIKCAPDLHPLPAWRSC